MSGFSRWAYRPLTDEEAAELDWYWQGVKRVYAQVGVEVSIEVVGPLSDYQRRKLLDETPTPPTE